MREGWEESKYKKVAMGGTFQVIHLGHKALLERAFQVGEEVIIGLTTDELAKRLHKDHDISPYQERKDRLEAFLQGMKVLERARIAPLTDPYGPPVTEEDVEAIIVSEETKPTAHRINRIREEKGYKPLHIIVIETILAEDGEPISTTKILQGKIDEEGRLL